MWSTVKYTKFVMPPEPNRVVVDQVTTQIMPPVSKILGHRILISSPFWTKKIAKCRENLALHVYQSKTRRISGVTRDNP